MVGTFIYYILSVFFFVLLMLILSYIYLFFPAVCVNEPALLSLHCFDQYDDSVVTDCLIL